MLSSDAAQLKFVQSPPTGPEVPRGWNLNSLGWEFSPQGGLGSDTGIWDIYPNKDQY